jgi:hypothetical protein
LSVLVCRNRPKTRCAATIEMTAIAVSSETRRDELRYAASLNASAPTMTVVAAAARAAAKVR